MCRCPHGALRLATIPPTMFVTPEGDAWRRRGNGPADKVRTGPHVQMPHWGPALDNDPRLPRYWPQRVMRGEVQDMDPLMR
jgi:hypothetical protein